MTLWPKQSECSAFYGDPRGAYGLANATWEAHSLAYISPPYRIFFLGKPARLRVHKKCADAFMAWLEAVWVNSGKDAKVIKDWGMDNYAGAYNFRLMTGGHALSMHGYGCAADFDAPRNGWRDRTPHFATLRAQVVKPFLALGGVWGGDWDGDGSSADERSCDGMHFQFARLG